MEFSKNKNKTGAVGEDHPDGVQQPTIMGTLAVGNVVPKVAKEDSDPCTTPPLGYHPRSKASLTTQHRMPMPALKE